MKKLRHGARSTLLFSLLGLLPAASGDAQAQYEEISAPWEIRTPRFKIDQNLNVYSQPITGLQNFQSRTDAEVEISITNHSWTFLATPSGWLQAPYAAGGTPDNGRAFFELKEGWIETASPFWDLRVGNQIFAWGTADQVNPTDVLNPRDYYDPVGSKKLPIFAGRLQIHPPELDGWNFQVIGIPFFKESRLPTEIPDAGTTPLSLDTSRWLLSVPSSVLISGTSTPLEYELSPATFPVTWGAGARLSATGLWGWDFGFSTFNGVEDLPRFGVTKKGSAGTPGLPITITLHPSYHRFQMFGFDSAGSLSIGEQEIGLRMESAYVIRDNSRVDSEAKTDSGVSQEILTDLRKDDFYHLVLGVDSTLPGKVLGSVIYANVQYVHYERIEKKEVTPGTAVVTGLPNTLPWDRNLTTYLEARLATDYKLTGTWLTSLKNGDGAISPGFRAQWTDLVSTRVSMDFFYGPTTGFFGQFRDNSRFNLGLSVVF